MTSLNAITDQFGEKLTLYSKTLNSDYIECQEFNATDEIVTPNLNATIASLGQVSIQDLVVGGLSTLGDTQLNGILNMAAPSRIQNPNQVTYVASASSLVQISLPTTFSISQVRYTRDEYSRYSADSNSYKSVWKGNISFFLDHGNLTNQIIDFSLNVIGIPSIFHNGTLLYVRGLGPIVLGNEGHIVARNVITSNSGLFNIAFQTFAPYQVTTPAGSIYCECEFEVMEP